MNHTPLRFPQFGRLTGGLVLSAILMLFAGCLAASLQKSMKQQSLQKQVEADSFPNAKQAGF